MFSRLFGKKPDLRQQLFEAAAQGDADAFGRLCRDHQDAIRKSFPGWLTAPESVRSDREQIKRYGNGLVAVARFFAERLGDPGLMQLLQGPPSEQNPVSRWQEGLIAAQRRLEAGEFAAARNDLTALLEESRGLAGSGADHLRCYTLGSLAACHFHLGSLEQAEQATGQALEICRQAGDAEGQARYLGELFELERYRGRPERASAVAAEIASLTGSTAWSEKAVRVRSEPLLRVVVSVDGREMEVDDFQPRPETRVQFGFVRNRATLGESRRLNQLGKELAGKQRFAEALDLFLRAGQADPYDPDPPFMVGLTLTYLKRYAEALQHYAKAEQLGPGWYHARSDAWLTRELLEGRLTHQIWETLMALEHLPPDEALQEADRALAEQPLLPPLLYRKALALEMLGRPQEAVIPLRVALEHNQEPNLQTRLLVRLGNLAESPEKQEYWKQAAALNGDLISGAMARVMLKK